MCLGVPGRIEEISGQESQELLTREGIVSFGEIRRKVNLAYVPEAKLGDYVVVHVGFAISILKEEEALSVYSTLKELNALEEA
jgi:hydrogenase expression/formation protein HypC